MMEPVCLWCDEPLDKAGNRLCSSWCKTEQEKDLNFMVERKRKGNRSRGKRSKSSNLSKKEKNKISRTMREFNAGKLRTRGGMTVTSLSQALAIAYERINSMK